MKKIALFFSLTLLTTSVFAQTPRLSLYEEFTGETCPPCAATNPGLCALLAQATNTAKCVAIKWQVAIPSAPTKTWSLYQTNKGEIDWRAYNYGYNINSAPSGRMDGQNVTVFGAASDHPADLTSGIIATAQSNMSAFNVTMTRAWSLGCTAVNLTVSIQASANFTASGNLVFRTVMVEKEIHFSTQPGTNGEKDFYDIAIKSFPSIQSGISLPASWTTGQSQTFTLNCPVPSYARNKNQIAFVGFIEDDGNRKVAQAVRTNTAALPTDALAALGASVNLSCSNVINPVVSVRNDGISAITSLSIVPYTDGIAGSPIPWTGNLAVGASTTIALSGVATSTVSGSHVFSFDVLLSAPLYNLTSNQNTATYFVAGNYQATPVSEGFVSATFPPAGWAKINTDGGPSWVRDNGSGGFNLTSESARYNFYTNTVVGDKDELYLPPINLSGTNTPYMSMDIAYAQRTSASNDMLEVMVSTNCGNTWSTVFSKSGAALSNVSPVSSVYSPDPFDPTHWRTELINLSGYNNASVLVKFVTTNDQGNNLFIDNVNLSQLAGVGITKNGNNVNFMNVFPNPAKDLFNVSVYTQEAGNMKVSVYNTLGQKVLEKSSPVVSGTNNLRFDTHDLTTGIYTVIAEGVNGNLIRKIDITK